MVAPGKYTAKLTASGAEKVVSFDVEVDPRVFEEISQLAIEYRTGARSLRGLPLLGRRLRRTAELVRAEPWLAAVITLVFVAVPWAVAMLNIAALRGG